LYNSHFSCTQVITTFCSDFRTKSGFPMCNMGLKHNVSVWGSNISLNLSSARYLFKRVSSCCDSKDRRTFQNFFTPFPHFNNWHGINNYHWLYFLPNHTQTAFACVKICNLVVSRPWRWWWRHSGYGETVVFTLQRSRV